MQIQLIILY